MFHKALRIIKAWVTQVYPFVLLKVLMLLNRLVDHFVIYSVLTSHSLTQILNFVLGENSEKNF